MLREILDNSMALNAYRFSEDTQRPTYDMVQVFPGIVSGGTSFRGYKSIAGKGLFDEYDDMFAGGIELRIPTLSAASEEERSLVVRPQVSKEVKKFMCSVFDKSCNSVEASRLEARFYEDMPHIVFNDSDGGISCIIPNQYNIQRIKDRTIVYDGEEVQDYTHDFNARSILGVAPYIESGEDREVSHSKISIQMEMDKYPQSVRNLLKYVDLVANFRIIDLDSDTILSSIKNASEEAELSEEILRAYANVTLSFSKKYTGKTVG